MRALWIGFCLAMVLACAPAQAVQVLCVFDGKGQGGSRAPFKNPTGQPATMTVLSIQSPGISSHLYAFRSRVRYQGVAGQAYLEMWSHFPDGGAYFSRTLATQGPMAAMTGDSDWRPIVLPFAAQPGGPTPEKLVFNVVLPGAGQVWLDTIELVEFSPGEDPLAAASGAWFGQSTSGLVGALAGTGLGLVCGLIGLLIGLGRGRGLALGLLGAVVLVGLGGLAAGLVALAMDQPFQVSYPFWLLGGLGLVLGGVGLAIGRVRYRNLELARMHAKDLAA